MKLLQILFYGMLLLYILAASLALGCHRRPKAANLIPNSLSVLASLLGIITSVCHLAGSFRQIILLELNSSIPLLSFDLSIDKLGAFFLLTLSTLVMAVSIYSIGYLTHYYDSSRHQHRNVGIFNLLYNVFILTLITVFTSGNMFFFLIAWELMSLVSYFLVVFETDEPQNQTAGLIYLLMTHLATAFLVIAFALIYHANNSLAFGIPLKDSAPALKNFIFICLLIGFGTKAGIIPLHIWLPRAHPAAPSNISALMSGIMIKTAIYGLIRLIWGTLGAEFQWWGIVVLILGAIATFLGVAYALMEHNIKRLLAYHSIENIGIILIGLGIALWAHAAGQSFISALALFAALFHLLNHAIFKGGLFLGAGAIHYSTGTKEIEALGGLLKKMPYSGLFFLIFSMAIAALPPFNGFVSEWLTYQSLFGNLLAGDTGFKIITMLSAAALAMAGALAAACFVKVYGIAWLGLPRSEAATKAREVPKPMLWGMGWLALLCVGFGVFPGIMVKLLNQLVANLTGAPLQGLIQGGVFFLYQPLTVTSGSIAPLWIMLGGIILGGALFLVFKLLGKGIGERKYTTWDCGFPRLTPRMQYSATGFSKPFRIVFRAIYRPTRELKVEEGLSPYYPKSLKYQVATEPIFEKYLYRPLMNFFTGLSLWFKRMVQTGSVHMYLIYIFFMITGLLIYYYFAV
ncbi:MAG: formate hydrogenlyase [Firmicutes bacterium]|nr:formate hydrogenlyase [Bacillota bacterium]